MISVAKALEIVLAHAAPLPARETVVGPAALGLLLAEDVRSDLDMPPFDKAMMDGFAIRAGDLPGGVGELAIVEEILAGQMPKVEVQAGQASRIMTGAPIPRGADAVVMIERCEVVGQSVRIQESRVKPGLNILERAREMRVGETILHAGSPLRPQEFGLLAAVGRTTVQVTPAPRVAILSTGDEIIDPRRKPGPGQIRNSNGAMLLGQVVRAGGIPEFLGIARDDVADLRAKIALGLQFDLLLLSGGVSAGKLDLVPGVLEELGVQAHFHKVLMKPGKPVLFGTHGKNASAVAAGMVFGLPGNPVSSLVCFELFVRPAIRKCRGLDPGPTWVRARMSSDFPYRTDRPTYHPARVTLGETGWVVEPTPWFGSPDLRGILAANAFVLFPEGDHTHRAGEMLSVLCVES